MDESWDGQRTKPKDGNKQYRSEYGSGESCSCQSQAQVKRDNPSITNCSRRGKAFQGPAATLEAATNDPRRTLEQKRPVWERTLNKPGCLQVMLSWAGGTRNSSTAASLDTEAMLGDQTLNSSKPLLPSVTQSSPASAVPVLSLPKQAALPHPCQPAPHQPCCCIAVTQCSHGTGCKQCGAVNSLPYSHGG